MHLRLLFGLATAAVVSCTPEGSDKPGDTGPDTQGDTGQDSGIVSGPTVVLLAPVEGETWFLNTRYDIVARVANANTATVTASGASATCGDLLDGILHCTVVPTVDAEVIVTLDAEGAGGPAQARSAVTARAAVGVIPNGEAFAMGAYEVMDESWFPTVAAGKFNVAQSYGTGGYTQMEWQEWAAAAGMWTMTRPSWDWQDPWGNISDSDTLAALAARTELGWWEIPETPVDDASYADEVAGLVATIRTHDDRPTQMYFWTSATAEAISAYVPSVSVISPGAYPEHACQVQPWIRWRITSAREAVSMAGYSEAERPVVGTADLYGRAETSCPELQAQLAQVRMNPLAQIAAGARGVIYFAWYYAAQSLDPAWGESALATSDLIMGESGLGLAVVHGQSLGDVEVSVIDGPAMSEAFTPAYETTELQYASIHAAAWNYAGTRFVVAVNYTDQNVTAEMAGFVGGAASVEAVGEGRTLSATAGVLTDSFEPWGAHVYRTPLVE